MTLPFSLWAVAGGVVLGLIVYMFTNRDQQEAPHSRIGPSGSHDICRDDFYDNAYSNRTYDNSDSGSRRRRASSAGSKCTICLEVLEKSGERRVLECAHAFHTYCIQEWLKQQKKCPICRTPIYA